MTTLPNRRRECIATLRNGLGSTSVQLLSGQRPGLGASVAAGFLTFPFPCTGRRPALRDLLETGAHQPGAECHRQGIDLITGHLRAIP